MLVLVHSALAFTLPTLPHAVARAGTPRMAAGEDAAKAAWLAKLDTPTWGGAGSGAVPAPSIIPQTPAPTAVNEDAAKAAWLAKLDQPSWGGQGGGASPASESAAKAAWLASLDQGQPSWVGRAPAAAPDPGLYEAPPALSSDAPAAMPPPAQAPPVPAVNGPPAVATFGSSSVADRVLARARARTANPACSPSQRSADSFGASLASFAYGRK